MRLGWDVETVRNQRRAWRTRPRCSGQEKLDLGQTSGASTAPGKHAGRDSEPSPVAGWLQAGAGPETETSRDHVKKTQGQNTRVPRPRELLVKGT